MPVRRPTADLHPPHHGIQEDLLSLYIPHTPKHPYFPHLRDQLAQTQQFRLAMVYHGAASHPFLIHRPTPSPRPNHAPGLARPSRSTRTRSTSAQAINWQPTRTQSTRQASLCRRSLGLGDLARSHASLQPRPGVVGWCLRAARPATRHFLSPAQHPCPSMPPRPIARKPKPRRRTSPARFLYNLPAHGVPRGSRP